MKEEEGVSLFSSGRHRAYALIPCQEDTLIHVHISILLFIWSIGYTKCLKKITEIKVANTIIN